MKLAVNKHVGKPPEPTVEFSLEQEDGEKDVDIYANGQLIAFFSITEDGIVLKLVEGLNRYASMTGLFSFNRGKLRVE